jgi:hypothetical protein
MDKDKGKDKDKDKDKGTISQQNGAPRMTRTQRSEGTSIYTCKISTH